MYVVQEKQSYFCAVVGIVAFIEADGNQRVCVGIIKLGVDAMRSSENVLLVHQDAAAEMVIL